MKDLSGTNFATESVKTAYHPVFLVEIDADSLTGSQTCYLASKTYTLSGQAYSDLLESIGDIEMQVAPGGGVAEVSDCDIVIRNEAGFSDLLENYTLENDEVRIYVVFATGSEASADKILLFRGLIHDVEFGWETFTLRCVDASLKRHRKIPRELADFVTYPYIPLENANKELPVVIGSLNTGPFEKLGAAPNLAPGLCVNQYSLSYIASKYAYSYGVPYVWFAAARRWGQVLEYTQTGAEVSIDSAKRYTEIRPIRALSTNDVATWYLIRDANTTTGVALSIGDDLDVSLCGCLKLGTLYDLNLSVYADAPATKTFSYTISFTRNLETGSSGTIVNGGNTLTDASKSWVADTWIGKPTKVILDPGGVNEEEHSITDNAASTLTIAGTWAAGNGDYAYQIRLADLTGSLGGSGKTTYILSLDYTLYGDTWDFENIEVELSTSTGSVTIYEVWLAVYFYEQETAELPVVFQALQGYKDLASQYQDGGTIYGGIESNSPSGGPMLENPAHVVAVLLRDRHFGLALSYASIDNNSIGRVAAFLSDWKLAFSLRADVDSKDFLNTLCKQTMLRIYEDYEGRVKLALYDKYNPCVAIFFHDTTIAVENPEALPRAQRSSFKVRRSPLEEVYNTFAVQYKEDYAEGEFAEFTELSAEYRSSGSHGYSAVDGTFYDSIAHFQDDGVGVGDTLSIPLDKVYQVTGVTSQTHLTISALEGSVNVNSDVIYYIGPFFSQACRESADLYKLEKTQVIKATLIRDSAVAEALVEKFTEYFVNRRLVASFLTWFNALNLEVGDFIYLDHPLLPASKQPQTITTLNGGIDNSTSTVVVTAISSLQTEDLILLDYEVLEIIEISGTTLTVLRGRCGTPAAAHSNGVTVYRLETKWEIFSLLTMLDFEDCAIRLTVREVPESYQSIGHWAEDEIPDWDNATEEQKAFYGFWTYDSGEIELGNPATKTSNWG